MAYSAAVAHPGCARHVKGPASQDGLVGLLTRTPVRFPYEHASCK